MKFEPSKVVPIKGAFWNASWRGAWDPLRTVCGGGGLFWALVAVGVWRPLCGLSPQSPQPFMYFKLPLPVRFRITSWLSSVFISIWEHYQSKVLSASSWKLIASFLDKSFKRLGVEKTRLQGKICGFELWIFQRSKWSNGDKSWLNGAGTVVPATKSSVAGQEVSYLQYRYIRYSLFCIIWPKTPHKPYDGREILSWKAIEIAQTSIS